MPLLDELVNHFRAEAQRLEGGVLATEAEAHVKALEDIMARRTQAAQAAFHQAEAEARDWLHARLHARTGAVVEVAQTRPAAAPAPAGNDLQSEAAEHPAGN